MKKARKALSSNKWVTLAWVAGLVVLWEIGATAVARTRRSPENTLPHLWQILQSVFSPELVSSNQTALQIVLQSAGITLARAGIGFLIGAAVGYALALLMSLSKTVEKIAIPYLMIIQMIPILGMAPIILAMTQNIDRSRIIIAAILTFYPVAITTLAGFRAVEKDKLDLLNSIAANKRQIYAKLMIPASMSHLFTGLKMSAPMAITASILVDTLQGNGGLGCMLSQSLKHAMSIYVFWQIVFVSAIVGILSYTLMTVLEKALSPSKWGRKVKLER